MVLLKLDEYDGKCKQSQSDQPCKEALEAFTLCRENHLHSESPPLIVVQYEVVGCLRVHISDTLMPFHKVMVPVEEQKASIGQEKQAILIGEDVWICPIRAFSHMLVADAPKQQSAVQDVNWDEGDSDGHFGPGCVVPSGETQHDRQTGEYLPLSDRILDKAVPQAPIREPIRAFRNDQRATDQQDEDHSDRYEAILEEPVDALSTEVNQRDGLSHDENVKRDIDPL